MLQAFNFRCGSAERNGNYAYVSILAYTITPQLAFQDLHPSCLKLNIG